MTTPTILLAVILAVATVCVPAENVRIIDGDTIEVTIDGELERVRYY
ncbi:hypothetical protein LCGC14_3102790, partial [marine sediment metagenome]